MTARTSTEVSALAFVFPESSFASGCCSLCLRPSWATLHIAQGASAKALVTALADEAVVVNYSVQDFEWTDGARQRQVPVRLYLPNLASASHPVPLVVFGLRRAIF